MATAKLYNFLILLFQFYYLKEDVCTRLYHRRSRLYFVCNDSLLNVMAVFQYLIKWPIHLLYHYSKVLKTLYFRSL